MCAPLYSVYFCGQVPPYYSFNCHLHVDDFQIFISSTKPAPEFLLDMSLCNFFHDIFIVDTNKDIPILPSLPAPTHPPPSHWPSPHCCLYLRVMHVCSLVNPFTWIFCKFKYIKNKLILFKPKSALPLSYHLSEKTST